MLIQWDTGFPWGLPSWVVVSAGVRSRTWTSRGWAKAWAYGESLKTKQGTRGSLTHSVQRSEYSNPGSFAANLRMGEGKTEV